MNDTTRKPMGPNVRRFVRSAWLLLIAQLLATLIALGATGWAAFYVADLRAERDALRSQLEALAASRPVADTPPVEGDAIFEPEPVEEDLVTGGPTPPETPTPRTPAPSRPPVAATPRTPETRAPEARRPAPETVEPRQPSRNTTYPGGLPGQGSNTEPPYVVGIPGRYDGGRVQAPNVNVDPGFIPSRPRRDPTPPQRDPMQPPTNTVPPQTDTAPAGPNDPVT